MQNIVIKLKGEKMLAKSIKKILCLTACVVLLASMMAGCKGSGGKNASKEKQFLIYNMGQEPDTIDPGLESTVGAANVCNQLFEGLMSLDKDNKPVPACAEKVDYDPKNPSKFVFHIKKGLKWSDGQPLTAKDFEYSWKRVLNPETAADYASYLYTLKNGEAYNSKKAKAEDVGVKAKDDLTLEVELEYPTSYFLELCTFPTLAPVRKDIVEKDPEKWTQSPSTYIGNGPFKMKEWVHDSYIEFVKNENYRETSKVKLESIKFVMVASSTQALTAWEAGEIYYIDDIPSPEIPRLLKDGKMVVAPYIGTYYIAVNNQKPVLKDPKPAYGISIRLISSA
jgi:oligopeptide transport system substrate-binding protein